MFIPTLPELVIRKVRIKIPVIQGGDLPPKFLHIFNESHCS